MVGVRRSWTWFLALGVCLSEVSGESRAIRPATSPQDHKVSVPPTTSSEEPQTTLTNLEGGGQAGDEKKTYNGAQVLELPALSKNDIETLIENGDVEHWGQNASFIQVYVGKENLPKVKSILAKEGVPFNVMINDVQRAIDTENPQMTEEEFEELVGRNGHRMNYQSYHHYRDIHGYLDFVANTYPSLVTVGTLGTSVEGRPLKYVKIKFGDSNVKSFWIDGGIHAREWISPAAVTYIIQELVENHDAYASELDGMEFYILPVMNPDGYEYTHNYDRLWRKNRRRSSYLCTGTDLNRNWGYKWGGKGSSKQQCKEIYGGTSAFSEPETAAVANFIINNILNRCGFVTFHSYGQYILYPFGYEVNTPTEDSAELDRVGRKAANAIRSTSGAHYTVGNSANTLYPASGGADDWAKGAAKFKFAYTIELRDNGQYGFLLPAKYILDTGKEAFAAIKAIATEIKNTC